MHADGETLRNYLLGTLDREQAASVAGHLDRCEICDQAVRQLEVETDDDFVRSLRAEPEQLAAANSDELRRFLARVEEIGRVGAAALFEIEPGSAPHDELPPDSLGQYQILEKIGQGGMGVVYKALHRSLKRIVAVKLLPLSSRPEPAGLMRFRREMEAVGRLAHPNVVLAHDAGEVDGRDFLVVEYVEGLDLSEILRRLGPWPIAEACEAIRQAATGLEAAHQLDLVHRDVKPSNLMLAPGGIVKVLDLGLARLIPQHGSPDPAWRDQLGDTPAAADDLTVTGHVMGTLDYMAPEQAENARVDIRADVYALGASLYKLLSGQAPLAGEPGSTPAQKVLVLQRSVPPALQKARPDVPRELAELVHRMLAKSPDERPTTPQQVADALAPFARSADLIRWLEAALAAPPTRAEPLPATRLPDSHREPTAATSGSSVTTNPDSGASAPSVSPRADSDRPVSRANLSPPTARSAGGSPNSLTRPGPDRRTVVRVGAVVAVLGAVLVLILWNREGPRPGRGQAVGGSAANVRVDDPPGAHENPRRAALAVLKVGGRVEVKSEGSDPIWVERSEDLPNVPFRITWIEVHRARAEPITTAWLRDVLAGAPTLDGIALHEQSLGDAAMSVLAGSGSLSHAMISDVGITDAGLAALADLPLMQLNAGKNPIGDDGIRALGRPAHLRLLVLTDTDVTDESMRQIAQWPRLRSLTLGSTAVSDRGLAWLENLAGLQEIDLDDTQVTPAGVARFRRARPECRVVHRPSNLR